MAAFWQDVRYGLRMLAKNRGFATVAILTLALGIGANTAILSVLKGIFFSALPYPSASRLVLLSTEYPGSHAGGDDMSYPDYRAIREGTDVFEKTSLFRSETQVTLTGSGEPLQLPATFVTPTYLDLLGAQPRLGRTFVAAEDNDPGAARGVILSQALWERRFGADPHIVGRSVILNQIPLTVVGVLPSSFRDVDEEEGRTDVWMPVQMTPELLGQPKLDQVYRIFLGVGRLKPGVPVSQATAELRAIAERLAREHPNTNKGFGLHARLLRDQLLSGTYSPFSLLMIGAVIILLISCANIASLLIAKHESRRQEFALRAALGASFQQILRMLLVESILLCFLGASLALPLAYSLVSFLKSWRAFPLPPYVEVSVDHWSLVGFVGISLLSALLFGLLPALQASRTDVHAALAAAGRGTIGSSSNRSRSVLVVAEVSLSVMLLIGAGLILSSLITLVRSGLGFRTENLLTMRLDLTAQRYTQPERLVELAKLLVSRMESVPGVKSVTLWGPNMLSESDFVVYFTPEGETNFRQQDSPMMGWHSTNPGGLGNLGIPIVEGRDFTWRDTADRPNVIIVSKSVADHFWAGQDPVGKHVLPRTLIGQATWLTVIGVTEDARHRSRFDLALVASGGLPEGLGPQFDVYYPYWQRPIRQMVLAVRTLGLQTQVLPELQRAVSSLDPDLPLFDVRTLDERIATQESPVRALASLMGVYALVALSLAALGIYGLLAHGVALRTKEMGIRMALGAQRRDILRLVMGDGLSLAFLGIVLGLAGALGMTRLIRVLLYGISPTDSMTYLGVALFLAAVASAACYIPARRATRVDPMIALRYE